jgi:uncharacterized phage protein gp47/JayE
MPYGVSSTGFEAKPLSVIETEMKDQLRQAISLKLNLGSRSLLGQLVGVTASQARQVWEALQHLHASRDPNQAEDDDLDVIGDYTYTPRLAAAPSVAYMTITLTANTYPIGSLRVNVAGDATKVFANRNEITVASTQTLTDVPFDCTVNGATVAEANTLTVITTPVTGFSSPTNPTAADVGRDRESNAEYRARRLATLSRGGSAAVDAIRADLLELEDVDYASVLENDTDVTDGNGIPPHSVWAIVLGATDAEVAATIFSSKAGGVGTHGTTTQVVTDASGNPHNIKFSRPTDVACKMEITFSWLTDSYLTGTAAQDAVKAAILAASEDLQGVGRDLVIARYVAAVMAMGTITDVSIRVAKVADPFATSNVVISPFQRATLVVGNLTTIATEVGANP